MRDSLIESPLTSTLSHYRDWDGLKTLHCDGVCASWLLGIRKGWLYFWWKLKRNNTLVRPYWVGSFHDVEGKRPLIQGCFEPPRNTHYIMFTLDTSQSRWERSNSTQLYLSPKSNSVSTAHQPPISNHTHHLSCSFWIGLDFWYLLIPSLDFPLVSDYLEPCGGSWTMIGQDYNCHFDPNKTWQELILVWLFNLSRRLLLH